MADLNIVLTDKAKEQFTNFLAAEEEDGLAIRLEVAGRGPRVDHLIDKLDISPPMVTFEDQIDIHYGRRHFQMIYIDHCHTKGDTVVWMPKEKVLFSGDLLTYRTHPVNRLGNFMNWIPALEGLLLSWSVTLATSPIRSASSRTTSRCASAKAEKVE